MKIWRYIVIGVLIGAIFGAIALRKNQQIVTSGSANIPLSGNATLGSPQIGPTSTDGSTTPPSIDNIIGDRQIQVK